jgi:hypothetical protein
MLPTEINKFFWEYEPASLDEKKNWYQIIERLLEYGDLTANRWVYNNYSLNEISQVVRGSRRISRKTALLWQNLLDIPKEEVICLNVSCQKTDIPFLNN